MTPVADPAPESRVAQALLHRTPTGWRTVVAEMSDAETSGKVTHGSLLLALPSDQLELAAAEFERMLRTIWGVHGPLSWRETQRDWWAAELTLGHPSAGSRPLSSTVRSGRGHERPC